jgi:hypothetical protein
MPHFVRESDRQLPFSRPPRARLFYCIDLVWVIAKELRRLSGKAQRPLSNLCSEQSPRHLIDSPHALLNRFQ